MIDAYTKSVLTVIAAALVGIVIQNTVGQVRAQSDRPQRVLICDVEHPDRCASLGRIGYWASSDRYGLPTIVMPAR